MQLFEIEFLSIRIKCGGTVQCEMCTRADIPVAGEQPGLRFVRRVIADVVGSSISTVNE